jgi:heat-inducible transcriptional repressor
MNWKGTKVLDARKALILKLIVREHVATAAPVASEMLVKTYKLGVSPATVRNEMSELEQMGFIYQPHTSAGRIPTSRGYRYYVERLMDRTVLSPEDVRRIRHQFFQVQGDLDEWVRLAAAVLARSLGLAALATPPRAHRSRLGHIDLVSLQGRRVLLVVVARDGAVKQTIVELPDAIEVTRIEGIAQELNARLRGLDQVQITRKFSAFADVPREVLEAVSRSLRQLEVEGEIQVYYEGLKELLRQPEFRQVGQVAKLLDLLEERGLWSRILRQVLGSRGVQVIIGPEPYPDLEGYSAVLARYGAGYSLGGVVGVLGPLRLEYERTLGTVEYVSRLMSYLVANLS